VVFDTFIAAEIFGDKFIMYWTVATSLSRFHPFSLKCDFLFHQIIIKIVIIIIILTIIIIISRRKGSCTIRFFLYEEEEEGKEKYSKCEEKKI